MADSQLKDQKAQLQNALPNQICETRRTQEAPKSISLEAPLRVVVRPDFYDYEPNEPDIEWHVNFADPRLFVAYGSRLVAQNEKQVAQHPLLASDRDGLLAKDLKENTNVGTNSTPILVRKFGRRWRFPPRPMRVRADRTGSMVIDSRILRGISSLKPPAGSPPPTITNFISMAPRIRQSEYTRQEIELIFATAYTEFLAAMLESRTSHRTREHMVVQTGLWGCRAFGGNRTLMVAMQILAAKAASINQMLFSRRHKPGVNDAHRRFNAAEIIELCCGPTCSLDESIDHTKELGYRKASATVTDHHRPIENSSRAGDSAVT